MQLYIEKTGRKETISFSGKASELLKKLRINPDTVMVVKNGTLISEDADIKNTDEIKILSVISGG